MNSQVLWYQEYKELIGYFIQLISCSFVILGVLITQRSMNKRAEKDNNSRLEQLKLQLDETKNTNIIDRKLQKAEEIFETLLDTRDAIVTFYNNNQAKCLVDNKSYKEFYSDLSELMYKVSTKRMKLELLSKIYFKNLIISTQLIQNAEKSIKPYWDDEDLNSEKGVAFILDGINILIVKLNRMIDGLGEEINIENVNEYK